MAKHQGRVTQSRKPPPSKRTGKRPGVLLVRIDYASGAETTYDIYPRAILEWEHENDGKSFREWALNPRRDMTSAYRLAWLVLNCRDATILERDREQGGAIFAEWLEDVAAADVVDPVDPTPSSTPETPQPSPAE